MTTVQITSRIQIEPDELLAGLAQLKTFELEDILTRVSVMLANRKMPNLSAQESELLLKINQALPEQAQSRYDALSEKLHDETISSSEHEELLALVDQVELADAERLESLIKLAQLREISLTDLMKQLDIKPAPVHV